MFALSPISPTTRVFDTCIYCVAIPWHPFLAPLRLLGAHEKTLDRTLSISTFGETLDRTLSASTFGNNVAPLLTHERGAHCRRQEKERSTLDQFIL